MIPSSPPSGWFATTTTGPVEGIRFSSSGSIE
jgi:hypothetical protein